MFGHTGAALPLAAPGPAVATDPDQPRIADRVIALDPWATETLIGWHTKLNTKDKPAGGARKEEATPHPNE